MLIHLSIISLIFLHYKTQHVNRRGKNTNKAFNRKKGVIPCRLILAMKSAQIKKHGGSEVIEINQSTCEPTVSSGKDFEFYFL